MVFRGYYVPQYYLSNDVSSRERTRPIIKIQVHFFLDVRVSLVLPDILASAMLPQWHCPSGFPCGTALHKLLLTHAVVLCVIQYLWCLTQRWLYFIQEWYIKSYNQREFYEEPVAPWRRNCSSLSLHTSLKTNVILINNLCTKTVTRMNLKINI